MTLTIKDKLKTAYDNLLNSDVREFCRDVATMISKLPASPKDLFYLGCLIFAFILLKSNIVSGHLYTALHITISSLTLYLLFVKLSSLIISRFIPLYNVGNGKINLKERKLDKVNFDQYAIHEAGHIVSLALYNKEPDTISAWVSPYKQDTNGTVKYNYTDGIETKEYILFQMNLSLAGQCCENIFNCEKKLGSYRDLNNWEFNAKKYLSSFETEYSWYSVPENIYEAAINVKTLKELKNTQYEEMKVFVEKNKELVRKVADELKNSEKLEKKRIIEIISLVSK